MQVGTRGRGGSTGAVVVLLVVPALLPGCGRAPAAPGSCRIDVEAAIADVEAGRRTTPLIEPTDGGKESVVTFLVQSRGGAVPRIVSDVTGWGESTGDDTFDLTVGTMQRVGSTDWYRLEARVASGARVEYLTVLGATDYRPDPHNPRHAERSDDVISELVTPGYLPPPALTEPAPGPTGRVVESSFDSRALGGRRRAAVYTPPGYRADGAYPVAVFHDGRAVAREGEAPRVLDWLIVSGAIEPIVAVFLESSVHGDPNNHEGAPMREFLTTEAPAWLAAHFGVTARPAERAIVAISYGAKDAMDAALGPSSAYGRLGLLIPGRRLRPSDLKRLTALPSPPLRVAVIAGRYDAANLAIARAIRQALTGSGHSVEYLEVPEGHSPVTWRNHLDEVLVSLFGIPSATSRLNLPGAADRPPPSPDPSRRPPSGGHPGRRSSSRT